MLWQLDENQRLAYMLLIPLGVDWMHESHALTMIPCYFREKHTVELHLQEGKGASSELVFFLRLATTHGSRSRHGSPPAKPPCRPTVVARDALPRSRGIPMHRLPSASIIPSRCIPSPGSSFRQQFQWLPSGIRLSTIPTVLSEWIRRRF